jgi:hypothetical protein
MTISSMLLVTCLATGSAFAATSSFVPELQNATPPPRSAPVEPSPESLERIQQKLLRDPAIKLDKQPGIGGRGLPAFRVRVDAPALTVDQILGPDFLRGPVPATGMTHQEFLDLVTPKGVSGYAAFTNKEGVTVAITATALHVALKQALEEWRAAKEERARDAARKEVEDAVAALRLARRDGGQPPK